MEIAAIVTAFLVGYAMKHGGLCTYAAALQIVSDGRFERLAAFLSAAAWTVLVVVPMAWIWPGNLSLSATHHQWQMAVSGGMLLGLGAYLNRGCVFGTFVQLVGGNLAYVATLAGMVAGSVIGKLYLSGLAPVKSELGLAAQPGLGAGVWVLMAAIFIVITTLGFSRPVSGKRPAFRSFDSVLVALALGAGGGWLFATIRGWDFASVLTQFTYEALDISPVGPAWLAIGCTLSMVAGGVAAAMLRNRFAWKRPVPRIFFGCLAGGMLMGVGAILVPGGNDGLLLSGIPAFAPHALVAYVAMLVVMVLLLVLVPNQQGYSIGLWKGRNP